MSGQVAHCWEKAGSYSGGVVVGCNVGKSSAQKVQNHIVYLTRP